MSKMAAFLRRPVLGPVVFGIVFGGVPFGLAFSRLSGRVVSPETLRFMLDLSPAAVALTSIGALLGESKRWQALIARASLTSFSACVPLPSVVCAILIFHDLGAQGFFNPQNVPVFVLLFAIWAGVATVCGWVLALLWQFAKERRRRQLHSNSAA